MRKLTMILLVFTLLLSFSACADQTEQLPPEQPYDPAVVPETEVFSPIDIEDTVVAETYNMFKIRFTDAYDIGDPNIHTDNYYFLNTYRTYRVTEKELANHHKLYAIFAPIEADEIKQTWAYEQIDEPTEDYDGRVCYLETEQVEQMARDLFGKDVKLTHEQPLAPDDKFLPSFNNGRYEWRDPNRGGEIPICWFCVPDSAEKSENYLVIYDKYFNATIINRESALFYGDSEFVNSIEIPDEYKPNEFNSLELINFDKYDEVVLNFGAPYKHTFKLAEDGTYFWVSSEPIEN
ncbi:MAG: hypothetical protein J6D42_08910 [Clostridia bacterium]|nr:hypothetical protein [Clostridia bacterium]